VETAGPETDLLERPARLLKAAAGEPTEQLLGPVRHGDQRARQAQDEDAECHVQPPLLPKVR
jgi:hypothetical protein